LKRTRPETTLFAHLRSACAGEWKAYTTHPFIDGLAGGYLPEACFRHYLIQDYLFLIHFARAYGLAAFKADSLDDIRAAAAGLAAMVDQEMKLHVAYCADWGLGEAEMAAAPEADATMAYTRYVLERGLAGDLLDLQVALAPCIVGYAEIGRALVDDPTTRIDGNPYRAWIEMYASADYQAVANAHVAHLDRLMDRRGGPGRFETLATTFRQATRLEAAFWEMALHPPAPSAEFTQK
jgi:thiaminase/transcriptional activator TenA